MEEKKKKKISPQIFAFLETDYLNRFLLDEKTLWPPGSPFMEVIFSINTRKLSPTKDKSEFIA